MGGPRRANRWLLVSATTLLVLVVAAGSARASGGATYCVNDASCPAGGISEADLQAALNAADANEPGDTIDLGPGTYSNASGFIDDSGSNAISIVGAGAGSTTVAATNSGATVLDFGTHGDSAASISDLTVSVPTHGLGVDIPTHVTNVAVDGQPGGVDQTGLKVQDATVTNATVSLPLGTSSNGINVPNEAPVLDGVTITADNGFGPLQGGSNTSYTGLRIFADVTGIDMAANNTTGDSVLTNSEIVMTGTGTALELNNDGGAGTLIASSLTIVGNGAAGSTGVASVAENSGSAATIQLSDSIVEGFASSLECNATSPGTAALSVSYSDFNPGIESGNCAVAGGSGNINANPDLIQLPDGDEPLAFDSPAIGTGNPFLLSFTPDLLGNPRPGAGNTRVAMGAFEYQFTKPTAAAAASPTSVQAGTPVAFSASGSSDINAQDALSYSWSFDDGGTATGSSVTHTFTTPGAHQATLTVTAPDGLSSTAQTTVTVSALPAVAPVMTGLAFDPETFRSAKAKHRHGKPHPLGSVIWFTLSEPASLAVTIERAEPGRKSGGLCVAPSRHHKRPHCTRWVPLGTPMTVSGAQGANKTPFGGDGLKPGNYRATVVATASGLASQTETARFTIVAR